MSAHRLLLIDDDVKLFDLLSRYLGAHGYGLEHAEDGIEGLLALRRSVFDAVLIDVMMPEMDGLEVLRRLRARSNVPAIMLTARGDEMDRVVGLELGADDYISKPFNPRELLARLRAVLRRAAPNAQAERLAVDALVVDVTARAVTLTGEVLDLTSAEFDILLALVRRVGRVVTRDQLLDEAGRSDVVVGARTVDVHISRLRQKLRQDPQTAKRIKTIRGVGYMFAAPTNR